MQRKIYEKIMLEALAFAEENAGENIPVAAFILNDKNEIVSRETNRITETGNPLYHAEILAINNVIAQSANKNSDIRDCTLVVTLEPCVMCAGAIAHASISKVVFGAYNSQFGGVGSKFDVLRGDNGVGCLNNKTPEIIGAVCEEECKAVLDSFFKKIRV